ARPARDEADAGPAGALAVGFGHHRRAAFVAADDDLDLGCVDQRIQHSEIALARHAEHTVDAVHTQSMNQYFTTGQGLLVCGHLSVFRCACRTAPESESPPNAALRPLGKACRLPV